MKRTQAAFTLLELMVAVTVLAILCAFAVPSFREYTRETRASAAHNDLVTAINLARSEALRRGMPIAVCASANGTSCSGSDDWSTGWVVFTDGTGTASALDADDVLLQMWQAQSPDLSIEGVDELAAIRYLNTGLLDAAAPVGIQLSAEGCNGLRKRDIAVAMGGSVSSAKTAC